MNRLKLSNIPLSDFRDFLQYVGCVKTSTSGGHEKWKSPQCFRSIIIQTHEKIVPEIVLRSNLKTLGLTRRDFELWLSVNRPNKKK